MTIRRYFTIPRGAESEVAFTWSTADGPVDLTDWAVHLVATDAADETDEVLDLTDLAGLTINAQAGEIVAPISAATSTDLPDLLVYRLLVTPPGGDEKLLARGTIVVAEAVTPTPPRPIQTVSATAGVLLIPGPQGDPGITVSPTPPEDPALNDLWLAAPGV